MYPLLRNLLFLLPPEKAHHFTVGLFSTIASLPIVGSAISSLYSFKSSTLEKNLFGLKFPNPVGLAAGFDKDGKYIRPMSKLGFGFIEIGTVTPRPQAGNPQPRMFRLAKDQALINRMGFNNDGVDALVDRLKSFDKKGLIVGGNIGKNKDTPNDQAVDDYIICFEKLHPFVDYFVVNVSSPNTPNLRALQERGPLTKILSTLVELNNKKEKQKPILLKIAPDLSDGQIEEIIEVVIETKLDGIIATNTTISRENLKEPSTSITNIGNGGLSGAPLTNRATEVIQLISDKTNGKIPIIGVGGINSPQDALDKLNAGASLIQIYTGFIYQGPAFIKQINKLLAT